MIAVVTWTPNTEPDIASYRIASAPAVGGPWTVIGSTLHPVTTVTTTISRTTFFRVTAVDQSGNESDVSAVESKVIVPSDLTVTKAEPNQVVVEWDVKNCLNVTNVRTGTRTHKKITITCVH